MIAQFYPREAADAREQEVKPYFLAVLNLYKYVKNWTMSKDKDTSRNSKAEFFKELLYIYKQQDCFQQK